MDKKRTRKRVLFLAGVAGFEPTVTESESVALPLGDTPNPFLLFYQKVY